MVQHLTLLHPCLWQRSCTARIQIKHPHKRFPWRQGVLFPPPGSPRAACGWRRPDESPPRWAWGSLWSTSPGGQTPQGPPGGRGRALDEPGSFAPSLANQLAAAWRTDLRAGSRDMRSWLQWNPEREKERKKKIEEASDSARSHNGKYDWAHPWKFYSIIAQHSWGTNILIQKNHISTHGTYELA